MPQFKYDRYSNPYALTLAEMVARAADPQARAAEAIGQAQARAAENIGAGNARAAEQSGNAWAGAIQNVGQSIASIPQRIEQQKAAEQESQLRAQHLASNAIALANAQRQQAGQSALANTMAGSGPMRPGEVGPQQDSMLNADGLFDVPKISARLGQLGFGDKAGELLKGAESINDSILRHQESEQQTAVRHAILLGDLADGTLKLVKTGMPLSDAMDFVVQPAIATKRIKQEEYVQTKQQILQMPPEQQQAQLGALMDQAAKLGGGKTLGKDAQELDRYGRVIASNVQPDKPNEAELALKAAGGDQAAIDAMNLLKPKPNTTAEQDDQRYRNIQAAVLQQQPVSAQDAAWAKGYEKQKTLGVDTSASAASNRQAQAIAAQTAQQGRAQSFTERQAGRKELTDKVETPYLTAKASANTLRDVVAEAKAGNKVAGSLQSLEATMAAIRAQGLNRINTAEIGATANAGSLWDNIVGYVGKKATGQPVPADIQKDMIKFADLLEKSAYKKYIDGHKATTTRYGLDEAPLPAPVTDVVAPTLTPGLQGLANRP